VAAFKFMVYHENQLNQGSAISITSLKTNPVKHVKSQKCLKYLKNCLVFAVI